MAGNSFSRRFRREGVNMNNWGYLGVCSLWTAVDIAETPPVSIWP